jgi:eukaryotic-like serine/threonine-protein kinase
MSVPKIPGYRIESLIGKGACGVVYAARHTSGARIAIKVLHEDSCNPGLIANQLNRLYRTECPDGAVPLIAHSLSKKPILLLGSLEADRVEQEIGEHYVPRTLQMRLADYLGKPESWDLVRKLADALADFHRRRVAHGNLKPGNIFLTTEGMPLLSDFAQGLMPGIRALSYSDALLYSPPEQLNDPESYLEGAGYGWDVYAFGVLAFRLMNGIFPRCDEVFAQVAPEPGQARRKGVEADCERLAKKLEASVVAPWRGLAATPEDTARREIIERCLNLEAPDRYTDMRDVVQALRDIGTTKATVEERQDEEERLVVEVRRKRWWRSVAGLGLAATVGLGGVAFLMIEEANKREQAFIKNLEEEQSGFVGVLESHEAEKVALKEDMEAARQDKGLAEERAERLQMRFATMGEDLAQAYELSDTLLAWSLERGATRLPTLEGRDGRLGLLERSFRDLLGKIPERPGMERQQWRIELALAEVLVADGRIEEARKYLSSAVEAAPDGGTMVGERVGRARVLICLLASEEGDVAVDEDDLQLARQAVERLSEGSEERERLAAALHLVEARSQRQAGNVEEALVHYRAAFEAMNLLCQAEPQNGPIRLWRVRGYTEAAETAEGAGVADAAILLRQKAAAELMAMLDQKSDDPTVKIELSGALAAQSEAHLDDGDLESARELALRGIQLCDEVLVGGKHFPRAKVLLGGHKSVVAACLHAKGDANGALATVDEGIKLVSEALDEDKDDELAPFRLALLKWQKATMSGFFGKRTDELTYGKEAHEQLKKILNGKCRYPSARQVRRALAYLSGDLGVAAQSAEHDGEAVEFFRESVALWTALIAEEVDNIEFQEGLQWAMERLSEMGVVTAVAK